MGQSCGVRFSKILLNAVFMSIFVHMTACRSASLCPTKQTQMDSGTRVKQKAKFFYPANHVPFFPFEFCSVMTFTLYFAQCISFSRHKALNILNFSCLPDASLFSTLRVPGDWYIGYLGWCRQPGPDCSSRQERSASFYSGTVFIEFSIFFLAFIFLSKISVSCSVGRQQHYTSGMRQNVADFPEQRQTAKI